MFAEVAPVVIGGAVGGDGQRGLFLVEQHLEEHILVLGILTVEDKLDVCPHGEDAVVNPAFFLELFHIVDLDIVAVDA